MTQFSVLFLTTFSVLYLAALLALSLNPYLALAGALVVASLVGLARSELRRDVLDGRHLPVVIIGVALVAWTRPSMLKALHWDVVSYGLMKYPEMRHGIIGPCFSYGNVYEFVVSYTNELFPLVRGVVICHSLSLFFLAVAALSCAIATRSMAAVAAALVLLFHDPTGWIAPALDYGAAGKSDILVAAAILLVWAAVLERRHDREQPIRAVEFVAINALAACAVGIKISGALAVVLPMVASWLEFSARARRGAARGHIGRVLCLVVGIWLFFCWQYVANLVVLGLLAEPQLAVPGMLLSPLGSLTMPSVLLDAISVSAASIPEHFFLDRFLPSLLAFVLTLVGLIIIGLVQAAGREVLIVRASALLLILLCPFLLYGSPPQSPQMRLVLPVILFLGIDVAAVVAGALRRGSRTWHRALPRVKIPALVGVPFLFFVMVALNPGTLSYEQYFYADYREAYTYFMDRPGTTIYAAGLRPFFLLGRQAQHRVTYDLNAPRLLRDDPARFVHEVTRCVDPEYLILPEVGAEQLRLSGRLEVVAQGPRYVVLRNLHRAADRLGCAGRYVMHP